MTLVAESKTDLMQVPTLIMSDLRKVHLSVNKYKAMLETNERIMKLSFKRLKHFTIYNDCLRICNNKYISVSIYVLLGFEETLKQGCTKQRIEHIMTILI